MPVIYPAMTGDGPPSPFSLMDAATAEIGCTFADRQLPPPSPAVGRLTPPPPYMGGLPPQSAGPARTSPLRAQYVDLFNGSGASSSPTGSISSNAGNPTAPGAMKPPSTMPTTTKELVPSLSAMSVVPPRPAMMRQPSSGFMVICPTIPEALSSTGSFTAHDNVAYMAEEPKGERTQRGRSLSTGRRRANSICFRFIIFGGKRGEEEKGSLSSPRIFSGSQGRLAKCLRSLRRHQGTTGRRRPSR